MKIKLAAAALLLVGTLAACDNTPDHPGEHCVRSHTERGIRPHLVTVVGAKGRVSTNTVLIPYSESVCDEWVPDNPATVKASK